MPQRALAVFGGSRWVRAGAGLRFLIRHARRRPLTYTVNQGGSSRNETDHTLED
jgi:hypothetical protein